MEAPLLSDGTGLMIAHPSMVAVGTALGSLTVRTLSVSVVGTPQAIQGASVFFIAQSEIPTPQRAIENAPGNFSR